MTVVLSLPCELAQYYCFRPDERQLRNGLHVSYSARCEQSHTILVPARVAIAIHQGASIFFGALASELIWHLTRTGLSLCLSRATSGVSV